MSIEASRSKLKYDFATLCAFAAWRDVLINERFSRKVAKTQRKTAKYVEAI